MITPIELHFYNKNNEVIKTYSQSVIKWGFFKDAVKIVDNNSLDANNLDTIYEFVRSFYGNRFSVRKLKKYTDVEQLLAVAGQIVMRVLDMMKREGVSLPNTQTVEKKRKSRILCRLIGFSKLRE